MRALVRLGTRTAWGRDARVRAALTVAGAAMTTVLLLGVAAVPGVVSREADRRDAQLPTLAATSAWRGLGFVDMTSLYRGRTVHRIVVAPLGPNPPIPPGLRGLPAAGEVMLSPRLASLIDRDPVLAAWFPQHLAGRISPKGLVNPDELRAYVGVTPETFGPTARPAVRFGLRQARNPVSLTGVRWHVLTGFALFVVVPAAVFFFACVRLGARIRDRRLRTLRVLGLSPAQLAVVAASETASHSLAGALTGVAVFAAARTTLHRLPVADRAFFATDVRVHPAVAVGVVAATTIVATGVAAAASRSVATLSNSVRPTTGRRRRPLALVLLTLGAMLLAAPVVTGVFTGRWPKTGLVFQVGLVMFGTGLGVALAYLTQRAALLLAHLPAPAGVLVGLRRLAAEPGTVTRITGGLCVAVFVVGASQPVLDLLNDRRSWRDWQPPGIRMQLRASYLQLAPIDLDDGAAPPGVHALLPEVALWTPGSADPAALALVATCAQLAQIADRPFHACNATPARLVVNGRRRDLPTATELRSRDRHVAVPLIPPSTTVQLTVDSVIPIEAAVVLPPDDAQLAPLGMPYNTAYLAVADADLETAERFRALVIGHAPTYRVDVPFEESSVPPRGVAWVNLGTFLAAAIAALGLVVAALDSSRQRRRHAAALEAIGTPGCALFQAHATELLLPAILGAMLATAGAITAGLAYTRARGASSPDLMAYAVLFAAAIVVVVTIVPLTNSRTRLLRDPSLLRAE